MSILLQAQGVSHEYPGVRALDAVSLEVRPGRITALVGPNGAGKSTLLRILAVLQRPLSGSVLLDGKDAFAAPREAHRHIGFLPDFFGLYDRLTVAQCLRYFAMAHQVEEERLESAIALAAERLRLGDRMQQRAGELSRGLRQRLAIAQAIVHRPPLLLLDEPASGLDPEARHDLSQLFLQLRDEGMTLLVSSHILSELDAYCDEMIVLRNGRIVEQQTVCERDGNSCRLRLRIWAEDEQTRQSQWERLQSILDREIEPMQDGWAEFSFDGSPRKQHELLRSLIDHGLPIVAFVARERSLQDAYLATRERA